MTHYSSSPFEQNIIAQTIPPTSLAATKNLVSILSHLLVSVCAETDWEYGESWIPDISQNILELSPAWCVNTNLAIHREIAWMQFQICSKAFVLHSGEGLPGRVWKSQQPEWIEDVSARSETYFLRNQIAKALGVKAGFGIPIMLSAQVLAVAVFFMPEMRSPDPLLMAQTQAIVETFQSELSSKLIDGSV